MNNIHRFLLTVIVCGLFFMTGVPAFAQSTGSDDPFTGIDLVPLGPEGEARYDVFTIGDNTQSYTATRWITPFRMNRYETPYQLWYDVLVKAEQAGYVFANPGQEGSEGRHGEAPSDSGRFLPVTMINWYDAIVWCNALSEQQGLMPCYTYKGAVLRDSSDTALCDLADCNWKADGYRLPTEAEWEYAARKTADGYQRGDLASGQINRQGKSDDSVPETSVAWFDADAKGTHIVGTAGTAPNTGTLPVPGSGKPNGSGLFDMSGNVLEFCWDWMAFYNDVEPGSSACGPSYGSKRISRGGSWSPYTGFMYAGDRYAYDPNESYNYMGFRFCTTK